MSNRCLFVAASVALAVALPVTVAASEAARITGPYTHANLSLYLIHGPSAPGLVPLTLQEALVTNAVVVHETGSVNELSIENSGDKEVFVQAGDIVKGGQQDRVLTVSLLLSAHSGTIPIAAYCVEHGRWTGRAGESATKFNSSGNAMHSRQAKIAMLAPNKPAPAVTTGATPMVAQRVGPTNDTSSRQREVWDSVATAQQKLSKNLAAPVAAPQSQTSLELTLENKKLDEARKAFVDTLLPVLAGKDDVIGYVFAVNGKLDSGDIYASNGLFQKMWPKLVNAAATEAIAEHGETSDPAPSVDTVQLFLASSEAGQAVEETRIAGVIHASRETSASYLVDTRRLSGDVVHRALVVR